MVLFISPGDLDFSLIGFLEVQRERVRSFPAEKLHRQGVTSCKKREGKEKEKAL